MTDDQKPQPMQDPGDDDGQGDGHDGLDLTARMQRATAHVEGRGVRIDAVPGRAEVVVGAWRRRLVAVAATVVLLAGVGTALAVRDADEPQEVVTAAPSLDSGPDTGDCLPFGGGQYQDGPLYGPLFLDPSDDRDALLHGYFGVTVPVDHDGSPYVVWATDEQRRFLLDLGVGGDQLVALGLHDPEVLAEVEVGARREILDYLDGLQVELAAGGSEAFEADRRRVQHYLDGPGAYRPPARPTPADAEPPPHDGGPWFGPVVLDAGVLENMLHAEDPEVRPTGWQLEIPISEQRWLNDAQRRWLADQHVDGSVLAAVGYDDQELRDLLPTDRLEALVAYLATLEDHGPPLPIGELPTEVCSPDGSAPLPGGSRPQGSDVASPETTPSPPTVDSAIVTTDEQPTRLLESGPTIPLGPCRETYPIPASTIGLETRIRSYGMGQIVVELRNTTDEDVVVLNGGRYVALGTDGNLRSDLHLNEGYTSEDEDPPASVVVPAGGSGEIRTPLTLVLSTASCDDTPSLYGDDPLVTEHEFVYLLGVEGSDDVYASEPDVLTIHGDGSASCAQPLAEDGDCPLPPGWSSGS